MRALEPAIEGYVERDGIKMGYEVFGRGPAAVVFPPVDPIVQSRIWKAQVAYLARYARVVTIDPRGNGRSDRPSTVEAYAEVEAVADTIAVMDEAGIDTAVLVGVCSSGWLSLVLAAEHPERVSAVVSIATAAPRLTPPLPARARYDFAAPLDTDEGWAKFNRHYWLRDYRGFAEFFFDQLLSEPHSTKQFQDAVGWALETSPEVLLLQAAAPRFTGTKEETEALLARVRCPVLAVHGDQDRCQPLSRSERVAELTGGRLVTLAGAGHLAAGREPVVINHLIREMLPSPPVRRWTRPLDRPKRALFLSSPIGLGHSARDVAIAQELRKARPGLQIDWLAQHPVTEVLRRAGERVHPASAWLASESAHIEAEAGEHDLHAFQAIRKMDEILVANFMVFADLAESEPYDLWIGDEAWDLDYFLHENPELKTAAYAWLTDFVGWLPVGDEADLTADYNAEMVEQVGRFPRLRAGPVGLRRRPRRPGANAARARPAGHSRVDGVALRLLRLRHRFRPGRRRRPGSVASRTGVRPGRAGLRGRGRRVRGGDRAAAAGRGRSSAGAGPADGDRHRARGSTRRWCRRRRGWRCCPTCRTSTGTWPPATWPSSKVDCPRRWS